MKGDTGFNLPLPAESADENAERKNRLFVIDATILKRTFGKTGKKMPLHIEFDTEIKN